MLKKFVPLLLCVASVLANENDRESDLLRKSIEHCVQGKKDRVPFSRIRACQKMRLAFCTEVSHALTKSEVTGAAQMLERWHGFLCAPHGPNQERK